jgi:hypothetical protein
MKLVRMHLGTFIVLLLAKSTSSFVSRGIVERKWTLSPLSTFTKVARPLSWPLTMSSTTTSVNPEKIDYKVLDQILKVAIDASKKAGDIIVGNAGGAEVTEHKANSRDLLTLIDPLCEKVEFTATEALPPTTQPHTLNCLSY